MIKKIMCYVGSWSMGPMNGWPGLSVAIYWAGWPSHRLTFFTIDFIDAELNLIKVMLLMMILLRDKLDTTVTAGAAILTTFCGIGGRNGVGNDDDDDQPDSFLPGNPSLVWDKDERDGDGDGEAKAQGWHQNSPFPHSTTSTFFSSSSQGVRNCRKC